jgi:hypothetical protein
VISPQPFNYAKAITTSDTVSLPIVNGSALVAFSVGVAGNVVVVFKDATTVTFAALAGTFYQITCERINATSTTATGLVAWYRV